MGESYPRLVSAEGYHAVDAEIWRVQNELILNAAGEGIYGLDLDGCCTFVNPAATRMTGHSPEELLGKSMHDVVHHSHPDGTSYARQACPIYAAFNDGLMRNVCEEVFWRKDGSSFPVEYTSTPIYNGARLVGAVVVFRDITLRHQTELRLRKALAEVQELKERLQLENRTLREEIRDVRESHEIIGSSPALRDTLRLVARVAALDCTVLIQGETGTGKELIARSIHRLSQRRSGPLIRLNCSAIASGLADSELFGHERGAFTGALQQRLGRFEQAQGGTLLLDEVGELSLETQAKLLRVLQERELERVGGNQTISVDVRVLAATNQNLPQLVAEGRFRSDLYFRLAVVPLSVPALRERLSDIPALVDQFLRRLEVRWGCRLGRVSEPDLARLASYHWPGNIRELQNVIERAAILGDHAHVPISGELLPGAADAAALHGSSLRGAPLALPSVEHHPLTRPGSEPPEQDAAACPLLSLEQLERQHITRVLLQTRWRLGGPGGAAEVLKLHPNTLRHRMKKLGIQR